MPTQVIPLTREPLARDSLLNIAILAASEHKFQVLIDLLIVNCVKIKAAGEILGSHGGECKEFELCSLIEVYRHFGCAHRRTLVKPAAETSCRCVRYKLTSDSEKRSCN